MNIIKIAPMENGSHQNQNCNIKKIPIGWAVVPDNVEIPSSYPFVDIEVENGIVVSMLAKEVPQIENNIEPTEQDDITAMMVDQEYRLTLLELGMSE